MERKEWSVGSRGSSEGKGKEKGGRGNVHFVT